MDIADVERARLRAVIGGDREALEALHHPDFVLCTPSGVVWDRATYLGGLVDGSIRYSRFEPVSDVEALAGEAVAAVRYRSVIDLVTPHGGGHLECWHLDVYQRDTDGRWRCRWSQATDTIEDGR